MMFSRKNYIHAEALWRWIDDEHKAIDRLAMEEVGQSSESYKLVLMGRIDQLHKLMDWIGNEETDLKDLIKLHHEENKDSY